MAAGLWGIAVLIVWCALWLFLLSARGRARHIRALKRAAVAMLVAALLGLSVMAARQAIDEFGPSWNAAAGNGTKGLFTAAETYELGVRYRHRVWRGRFVGEDGRVIREPIDLEDAPPDTAIGRPVPAIDTGAARVVYGVPSTSALAMNIITIVVVVVGWIAATWLLLRGPRRRRASRSVTSPSEGVPSLVELR